MPITKIKVKIVQKIALFVYIRTWQYPYIKIIIANKEKGNDSVQMNDNLIYYT